MSWCVEGNPRVTTASYFPIALNPGLVNLARSSLSGMLRCNQILRSDYCDIQAIMNNTIP